MNNFILKKRPEFHALACIVSKTDAQRSVRAVTGRTDERKTKTRWGADVLSDGAGSLVLHVEQLRPFEPGAFHVSRGFVAACYVRALYTEGWCR